MTLQVSGTLSLPVDVARRVFAFLAMRGAGKTYCAAVLAEEMLKASIPIIVIDPMSVWWGLRTGREGTGEGLPIVIFGGDHADLPLDPDKAEELAHALVESGISAVLDIGDFSQGQTQRFIPRFLNELRRIGGKRDTHIFLEEADVIAPQKPMRDETVCLHAVDVFVRRGGNKNFGCTLISQRSAVVNKNVLTQSDFLVVLRTNAPQDKEAVAAWAVRRTSNKGALNKWLDSLSELRDGQAFIWGPDMNIPGVEVQFRQRETFHATRENLKLYDASKIETMPVDVFVQKFRRVFEGKKATPARGESSPRKPIPVTTEDGEEPVSAPRHPARARGAEPAVGAPPTPSPPALPQPAKKALATFTLEVTRLQADSFVGKVVFVLNRIGKAAYPKEIGEAFAEYGWPFSPKNFATNIAGALADGTMLKELNGTYRLPKEMKVEEVAAT